MHGFCISYLGNKNEIQAGWYKNNFKRGNFACAEGPSLKLIDSGWYQGYKMQAMVDDEATKKFEMEDLFIGFKGTKYA